ncbi:MAG TPA: hypothetical protein VFG54_11705 [Prolixibacteraceae bacterium]|nr:hypothetical protein [Prolixibacteraceae bacterium]
MKLLPALTCFIIVLFIVHLSEAQEVFTPASRSQSLAGASATLEDSWSVFGNQAGLAGIQRPVMGGTFQNRFLVKELSTSAGLFILPVQSSVFALSLYQFGKTAFRQEKLGIAYARSLNPRLQVGMQFNYYRYFMAEENKTVGTYGIELGCQYHLKKKTILGFHVLNPYKTAIKTYSGEYNYPVRYTLGSWFQLSNSFGFVTELEKQWSFPLIVKTGFEYDILDKLMLRTGFSAKPYQLTAGMGFEVKHLKIDLAVAYNQYLGNSPSASFQYQF